MYFRDSQFALCVLLLSEVSRNVSSILPTAWLEFITIHLASSVYAQYTLCKWTLNVGTTCESAGVTNKTEKTPVSF